MSVEFVVGNYKDNEEYYTDIKKAILAAFNRALSSGSCQLDVLCYSVEDARAFSGDSGEEQFESDPEASVFQRLILRVEDQGLIH